MLEFCDDDDDPFASGLSDDDFARFEIMERIREKYVGSNRDKALARHIEFLIERMYLVSKRGSEAPKLPMQARQLVLIGESGAGKTTGLVRQFLKNNAFPGYGVSGSGCPLVSVEAPSPCTMKRLGREILEEIGYPLVADPTAHRVWELVRQKLMLARVRVLHLDEAHNITRHADVKEAEEIKNTLKFLLNNRRHPVSFIISGLPDIAPFFAQKGEMRRRSRFLRFESLGTSDQAGVQKNLVEFASIAKFRVWSWTPNMCSFPA